jgi:LmbE family N-acetylglucosaminyl deacetylase
MKHLAGRNGSKEVSHVCRRRSAAVSRPAASRWVLTLFVLATCCVSTAVAAKKNILLVVLTHGDDYVAIAPLIARAAAEGHTVYYAMFTGVQDLAGIEGSPARAEALCGAKALGVKDMFVMRGPAGESFDAIAAIAERLITIIDQTKPDVVVTWGPDGLTGHPRHILVSNVVTRVFQQRRLVAAAPRKLYYIAYPESRFAEKPDFGRLSEQAFGTVSDDLITTTTDGRRYLTQARAAIACHTLAQGGYASSAAWRQAWIDHTTKTLGGTVFLRRVFPAVGQRETDIFDGL